MATIKNTIALLEQRIITEKYGIPLLTFSPEDLQQAKQKKKPAKTTVSSSRPLTWAVVTKKANVRGGPGKDYTKLFELSRLDEFEVMESEGNWLRIITKDKREGWLYRNLAKPK
jgi:SH3-like domain-containing protein